MRLLVAAGHSNIDPGAVAHGFTEAEIVADFRNMVAHYLRAAGHEVVTDGEGKENQPLAQAIKLIPGTDLAIEFHCNAAANPSANGVESISLFPLKSISQRISAAVAAVLGSRLRGERMDRSEPVGSRQAGIRQCRGPCGGTVFITNLTELQAYQAKNGWWHGRLQRL